MQWRGGGVLMPTWFEKFPPGPWYMIWFSYFLNMLCEFQDKRRYPENHEKSSATYFGLDFEKNKAMKLFSYLIWALRWSGL